MYSSLQYSEERKVDKFTRCLDITKVIFLCLTCVSISTGIALLYYRVDDISSSLLGRADMIVADANNLTTTINKFIDELEQTNIQLQTTIKRIEADSNQITKDINTVTAIFIAMSSCIEKFCKNVNSSNNFYKL